VYGNVITSKYLMRNCYFLYKRQNKPRFNPRGGWRGFRDALCGCSYFMTLQRHALYTTGELKIDIATSFHWKVIGW